MYKKSFIGNNREINPNIVKKHVASLKKIGRNLVSLQYVEAKDAEGYQLYDADNGKLVDKADYNDYWVVLDGQHRYKAARLLEKDGKFNMNNLRWEKVELGGFSLAEVLTEINSVSFKWNGSDYIHGFILQDPGNELVQFANTLNKKGVSGKTIGKYLTFRANVKWADPKTYSEANLDRARRIWKVVETFPDNIAKSSIIIDAIIEWHNWERDLGRIADITDQQKETLKVTRAGELKGAFLSMVGE